MSGAFFKHFFSVPMQQAVVRDFFATQGIRHLFAFASNGWRLVMQI